MNLSCLLVFGAALMSLASHANAWMDEKAEEYEFGIVSDMKNLEEDNFVGTSGAFSGVIRKKGVNQMKNNDDDWTIMKIFERAQKEHSQHNDKLTHGNNRNLNGVGHPKHTLERFVGTSGAFAGHARQRNDESRLETHRNDNRVTHRNHNHSLEETFANNEDFSGFELKTNQQSQIGNSADQIQHGGHKHFNRNDGHLNRNHPDYRNFNGVMHPKHTLDHFVGTSGAFAGFDSHISQGNDVFQHESKVDQNNKHDGHRNHRDGDRILHSYHNHVFGQAIGSSGAFAESQVNQMKNNDIDWTTLESPDI